MILEHRKGDTISMEIRKKKKKKKTRDNYISHKITKHKDIVV